MNLSESVVVSCFMYSFHFVKITECSSLFKTISYCSSTNRNETYWSEFDDIAVTIISQSSVISTLVVSHEELCIMSCQKNILCLAIQVNKPTGGGISCQLISFTPSMAHDL